MRLEIDDGFFSYLHKAALFRLISHCLRVKTSSVNENGSNLKLRSGFH